MLLSLIVMRRAAAIGVVLAGLGLVCGDARADGAFPDSTQIFLPPDRPHEIILATNFGMLYSEDDGASWRWVCEQAIGTLTQLYQMGPPPDERLFGISTEGLTVSGDNACSWSVAGGAIAHQYTSDAFPDPNDPQHVLAITAVATDASSFPPALFQSTDGGATFSGPMYTPPVPTWLLAGVEVARGAPQTIFLVANDIQEGVPPHPHGIRSIDGGVSWTPIDLGALGMYSVGLIAIDPSNPLKVYLRVKASPGDLLGILDDTTVRVALTLPETMSNFYQRPDGRLYVMTKGSGTWISSDGGANFAKWPGGLHLRALRERAGALYAASDNFMDMFAVAVSMDDGITWRPLLRFDHICGVRDCGSLGTTCAAAWAGLKETFGIADNACNVTGTGGTGGSAGGSGGCSCQIGAVPAASGGALVLVLLLAGLILGPAAGAYSRSRRARRGQR